MDKSPLRLELWQFCCCWGHWFKSRFQQTFNYLESSKSNLAARLYQQRGRWARPFTHSGMAILVVGGITLGPMIIKESFTDPWSDSVVSSQVLSAETSADLETSTLISQKPRAEVIEYLVKEGDTISTIAEKFGISVDTIRWENGLKTIKDIKPGQKLQILPQTGIMHQVKHGDTIYSIAKKYQVDAQVIVDWPYNSFANDENFALADGQSLMIPEGIKPKEILSAPRLYYAQVPGAGLGTGQFVWATAGKISQNYAWYHKAIDIANSGLPDILASDGGTVIIAGWPAPTAYGNRVIIDHSNGLTTLYGHLSQIYIAAGQKVAKGQVIGKMGSTGRSTGPHLHFEVRLNGEAQNPLSYLK